MASTHDIMILWYHMSMISWLSDFWFQVYDIIDCFLWFHSHKIIIWFHEIITSYMISLDQISVVISYAYDIMGMIDMYDFMVIKSLHDFMESWNHIWYSWFEYQWWYHTFQEWNHCMISLHDVCHDFINFAMDFMRWNHF